jgi:hypothetical protein
MFDKLKQWLSNLYEGIKTTILNIYNGIKDTIVGIWEKFIGVVESFFVIGFGILYFTAVK